MHNEQSMATREMNAGGKWETLTQLELQNTAFYLETELYKRRSRAHGACARMYMYKAMYYCCSYKYVSLARPCTKQDHVHSQSRRDSGRIIESTAVQPATENGHWCQSQRTPAHP